MSIHVQGPPIPPDPGVLGRLAEKWFHLWGANPGPSDADAGHVVSTSRRFDPYGAGSIGGDVWLPSRIYDRWQELAAVLDPADPSRRSHHDTLGAPVTTYWTYELQPYGLHGVALRDGLGMATRFDYGILLVRHAGDIRLVPAPCFGFYWTSLGRESSLFGPDVPGLADRLGLPDADPHLIAGGPPDLYIQPFSVPGTTEGVDVYWRGDGHDALAWLARHSALTQRWTAGGGGQGPLGWPRQGESAFAPPEAEHDLLFDRGSLTSHPQLGVHQLDALLTTSRPALYQRVSALDPAAVHLLARITSDARPTARGGSGYDVDGGLVLQAPGTAESQFVHGAIAARYRLLGAEAGFLGYPLTCETAGPGSGRYNRFENGSISWDGRAAYESHGPIHTYWAAAGHETSRFGYPQSDVVSIGAGGQQQAFQHGTLEFRPGAGVYERVPATPPPPSGMTGDMYPHASSLQVWNCSTARNPMHVWIADLTAGTGPQDLGEIPAGWVGGLPGGLGGFCGPGQTSPGLSHELTDGHLYQIRYVVPANCGGNNDPNNGACLTYDIVLRGDASADAWAPPPQL